MSVKVCRCVLITLLIIIFTSSEILASTTDTSGVNSTSGYISDPVSDIENPAEDVVALSWSLDKNYTYLGLYVYRLLNEGNWNYTVNIINGTKKLKVKVECINDANNIFTSVQNISLYDSGTNTLLFSSTSQWFLGVFSYIQIPLNYIVDSIQSGFEFDFNVVSGDDFAPDSGYIKISSVPTYPWYFNLFLLGFPIVGWYLFGKKKNNFYVKG